VAKKEFRIGGTARTVEGIEAERVEVGERSRVRGPIRAKEVYVDWRGEVEDVEAERVELEDRARARNIRAKVVVIGDRCKITGKVEYEERLEVGRDVYFAEPPVKIEE